MDLYSWPIVGGILGSVRRRGLKKQAEREITESRGEQVKRAWTEMDEASDRGCESDIIRTQHRFEIFFNRWTKR